MLVFLLCILNFWSLVFPFFMTVFFGRHLFASVGPSCFCLSPARGPRCKRRVSWRGRRQNKHTHRAQGLYSVEVPLKKDPNPKPLVWEHICSCLTVPASTHVCSCVCVWIAECDEWGVGRPDKCSISASPFTIYHVGLHVHIFLTVMNPTGIKTWQ